MVTVVGASGALGTEIVRALRARGVEVRAMVRATSDRSKLEALGVTDFVVADLGDTASLQRAMAATPKADAVIASAAGFSRHSTKTKGNDADVDVEGYRQLIAAVKHEGIARFVLISILGCDRAPDVPHLQQKYEAEKALIARGQPYLSLRAGAFLDRAQDIVAPKIREGVYPDFVPGTRLSMVYTPDLARCAVHAALDVPNEQLNRAVDICWPIPVTGADVATAFSTALGRRIVAKPALSRLLLAVSPLLRPFSRYVRDNTAVLAWIKRGNSVSTDPIAQNTMFGAQPDMNDAVCRYVHDKGLR